MLKKIIVTILLLFSIIGTIGIVERSPYDTRWEITVINCNGEIWVFNDCVITNQGQDVVTFIPGAGRIPTGNEKTLKIFRDNCTSIFMEEE